MNGSGRAYAQHRGCSVKAVRKALADGHIQLEPDGSIDFDRADAMWKERTDPARGKPVRTSQRDPHRINGFNEVDQIRNPAKQSMARMMVHAAGAAMWSAAWDIMEAGATIEVAFVASRLVGKSVLEMLYHEQAGCGIDFLLSPRIVFDPPEEWVPDYAELAQEYGQKFDLHACLEYEQKRKRVFAEMD